MREPKALRSARAARSSAAVLSMLFSACAPAREPAPAGRGPAVGPGVPGPAASTASGAGAPAASFAPGATDAWQVPCARSATCGACLNSPPCQWCAETERCLGPAGACRAGRVAESAACTTAPLALARLRHAELAAELARYEVVRETKTHPLASFRQERFFLNPGDCFAVLSETIDSGAIPPLQLHYALQESGVPDPARKQPKPEAGTGRAGARAQLSPEWCPWEPIYFVVSWLTPSEQQTGGVRLHLLRRAHPDPARLAREIQAAAPRGGAGSGAAASGVPGGYGGGNCSSYECGEDCRSELRACKLDCFRYGRHEMGSARLCEASCNQALRSCERSCRIPCPR